VLRVLRTDEAKQIDELLEKLETQLTSSEVFTALFEPAGKELRAHPLRSSGSFAKISRVQFQPTFGDDPHISETLRPANAYHFRFAKGYGEWKRRRLSW
jgi:hypothetical protein